VKSVISNSVLPGKLLRKSVTDQINLTGTGLDSTNVNNIDAKSRDYLRPHPDRRKPIQQTTRWF